VLIGNLAGQVAFASFDGRYRLYGAAGATSIEAKSSGYRDGFRQTVVTDHDQPIDFSLIAASSPEGVEGLYTLTLAASTSCRNALPEEVRQRTYLAD
jgi:hypothetical protein